MIEIDKKQYFLTLEGENADEINELKISLFLKNSPHFKISPIFEKEISPMGSWQTSMISENGTIRTLPFYLYSLGGMDSFFICKLKRII